MSCIYDNIAQCKKDAQAWFASLQSQILGALNNLEDELGSEKTFQMQQWEYQHNQNNSSGGGIKAKISHGAVFAKGGVNFSAVSGTLTTKSPREQFMYRKDLANKCHIHAEVGKQQPAAEGQLTINQHDFFACGVSLVLHPLSPFVPIIHMNTRFMCNNNNAWIGGGIDLTPVYPNDADTKDFHACLERTCNHYNPHYYPEFKDWCDEYFFLPHRKEHRGVGGIFYDYLNSGNWESDFNFTKSVGNAFLEIYPVIVRRHYKKTWNDEQIQQQLRKRSRYVEFNLLYDRGTRFGLQTGGDTDAILMSMPPLASWN